MHILNALCWSYTEEDHKHLLELDLFGVLQKGDGDFLHPILRAWGQEQSQFSLQLHKSLCLCMASRLRQVFEFLMQTILVNVFLNKETDSVSDGETPDPRNNPS